MNIALTPFNLPFVATPSRRYGVLPSVVRPPPPRIQVIFGLGADAACTLQLVDLARSVFTAAGMATDMLDLGRLHADGEGNRSHELHKAQANWSVADGVLILLPTHWRQMSSALRMMIDREVEMAFDEVPPPKDRSAFSKVPSRAYGLVVQGSLPQSLRARRAVSDWLDCMGLIDACEQARMEHFMGMGEPVPMTGFPLERDAALEQETYAAARAVVNSIHEIRAGRLERHCALMARAWPR